MSFPILTRKEAKQIVEKKNGIARISLDLGVSLTDVLVNNGFAFIGRQKIAVSDLIRLKENTCYLVEENTPKPIAFFSNETNLYYKLVPTKDWPTIMLSSTPMHRHTSISPKRDTQLKIIEISPVRGIVLDTCCGLGYTAILSSKKAVKVLTFENDRNVISIAKLNPHSMDLFCSKNIELYEKNIFDEVKTFEDSFFDRIIHDPPTFSHAPELYSMEFHSELYRVLKKKGILYHYCPSPQKTKGRNFYARIKNQLKNIGFRGVNYHAFSSGIRALK